MSRVASWRFKPSESTSVEIRMRVSLCPFAASSRAAGAVIVRGKPLDGVAALDLARAVNLLHPLNARFLQLPPQIARRGHELGKDQHLVLLEHRVRLEEFDQRLELVVVAGIEGLQLLQDSPPIDPGRRRSRRRFRQVIIRPVQHLEVVQELIAQF